MSCFFCTVTRMYSVLELVKWLVRISCWELYSPAYLMKQAGEQNSQHGFITRGLTAGDLLVFPKALSPKTNLVFQK